MRGRLRVLAGVVAIAMMSGGATTAAADVPATPASSPVRLPDLGITHRLADGGMNVFRVPLSELEEGYGEPELVRRLPAAQGWRYDRSVHLTGDFGDITAGDDGTADHVIWHATADGSIKIWAIGGGVDTAPRLWHTLSRRAGWNWSATRPLVADLDADGWDDVLVRVRGGSGDYMWMLRSDGTRLGPPQFVRTYFGFGWMRDLLLDLNHDAYPELVMMERCPDGSFDYLDSTRWPFRQPGAYEGILDSVFDGSATDGWLFWSSRVLGGDVSGDGRADLVTVRARPGDGGFDLYAHTSCSIPDDPCLAAPVLWQSLGAGDWSFGASRHHLADTDGDGRRDVITVHRAPGRGVTIWRHVASWPGFAAPEMVADLRSGGWNWSASRESVAHLWGVLVP